MAIFTPKDSDSILLTLGKKIIKEKKEPVKSSTVFKETSLGQIIKGVDGKLSTNFKEPEDEIPIANVLVSEDTIEGDLLISGSITSVKIDTNSILSKPIDWGVIEFGGFKFIDKEENYESHSGFIPKGLCNEIQFPTGCNPVPFNSEQVKHGAIKFPFLGYTYEGYDRKSNPGSINFYMDYPAQIPEKQPVKQPVPTSAKSPGVYKISYKSLPSVPSWYCYYDGKNWYKNGFDRFSAFDNFQQKKMIADIDTFIFKIEL